LLVTGLVIPFSVLPVRGVWDFPWFRLSRGKILLVLLATTGELIIGLFFIPENGQVADRHREFGVMESL